jgi:hypothetical protein
MAVTYMLLLGPTVVLWVALMAIKLFLYLKDPLRRQALSASRDRSIGYLRALIALIPEPINESAPQVAPLPYRDLPSRPINKQKLLALIEADFSHAGAFRQS